MSAEGVPAKEVDPWQLALTNQEHIDKPFDAAVNFFWAHRNLSLDEIRKRAQAFNDFHGLPEVEPGRIVVARRNTVAALDKSWTIFCALNGLRVRKGAHAPSKKTLPRNEAAEEALMAAMEKEHQQEIRQIQKDLLAIHDPSHPRLVDIALDQFNSDRAAKKAATPPAPSWLSRIMRWWGGLKGKGT